MPSAHRPRPAVLCILDGWGHRPDRRYNAILDARTPNYDRMIATCPQGLIDASETFVGLPKGQMGNSEVGHMNLGAGRVAVPDLPRIDKAIEDGSLAKSPILAELIATLKKSGGACHLMGLASPGGVHAHQDHLIALANLIAGAGVPVWIHAFLDGRDMPPRSAHECLAHIQAGLKAGLPIRFATVTGRYYPMDRDKRWERVDAGLRRLVDAKGERAGTPDEAVDKGYAAKLDDEFVLPTVIEGYTGMKDGDGVLMFNYRSDRAREILTALLDPRFDGFNRARVVKFAEAVGMVEYSAALNPFLKTLFPPEVIKMGLGETIVEGRPQAAAHRRDREVRARHVLLQRRRGARVRRRGAHPRALAQGRDLRPQARDERAGGDRQARRGDRLGQVRPGRGQLRQQRHGRPFRHLAAAVKAVEAVDACLGRLMEAVKKAGGVMLVTADHGNAEQMYDETTHQKHTQHTLNRVPALLFNAPADVHSLADGKLADVAPTLLALMQRAAAPGNDRPFAAFRGGSGRPCSPCRAQLSRLPLDL